MVRGVPGGGPLRTGPGSHKKRAADKLSAARQRPDTSARSTSVGQPV